MADVSAQQTPIYDFGIKQGATFRRHIRFKVGGVTQSLANHVVELFIRPNDSSDAIDLSSEDPASEDQHVIINTTVVDDNFVEIYFSEQVSGQFNWTQASYRLDVVDPASDLWRKLKGIFVLEKKIT